MKLAPAGRSWSRWIHGACLCVSLPEPFSGRATKASATNAIFRCLDYQPGSPASGRMSVLLAGRHSSQTAGGGKSPEHKAEHSKVGVVRLRLKPSTDDGGCGILENRTLVYGRGISSECHPLKGAHLPGKHRHLPACTLPSPHPNDFSDSGECASERQILAASVLLSQLISVNPWAAAVCWARRLHFNRAWKAMVTIGTCHLPCDEIPSPWHSGLAGGHIETRLVRRLDADPAPRSPPPAPPAAPVVRAPTIPARSIAVSR